MEPEVKKEQAPQEIPEQQSHTAHTYQDDLSHVMNVTEAPVVQAMLADAREREVLAQEEVEERREEKWYSVTGLVLIALTVLIIGAGIYYYKHLTVPIHSTMSVGVFPNTANFDSTTTSIDQLMATLAASTTLPEGRPTLVNVVTNAQTNILLTDTQLFAYMGASVPEPLQSAISVARLGVLNNGKTVSPFIIASVPNPEVASKEFTIAEPTMLQLFAKPLQIDPSIPVAATFQSQYFYNLPVRTLSTAATPKNPPQVIFLYGYANNNTVVITSDPTVLKAVYDTIINQH